MPKPKEKCVHCGKQCHTFIEEGGKKFCCQECCKDAKEETKRKEEAPKNVCQFC